jgi:hypothetical protein
MCICVLEHHEPESRVLQSETGLLYEPKIRDEYWQNGNIWGDTELVWRKPTILSTTDFTWTALGLSQSLCDVKPVVSQLSLYSPLQGQELPVSLSVLRQLNSF